MSENERKYQGINFNRLPKEIVDEFLLIHELTDGFKGNIEPQLQTNFDDLYEIVKQAYPDAIIELPKIENVVKANPSRIMVAKPAAKPAAKKKRPYSKPVLQKAITKSDIALLAEGPGTLIVKKNPFAKKKRPYNKPVLKKATDDQIKASYLKRKMADAGAKSGKKVADSKKKQAKYAVLLKKIASYKEQLKDNDAAKTKIAAMAAKQYAEIDKVKSLGRTKFEVDYEKAVALDKLYREFLTADKRKFKGIKDRAEGKGRVSKPKTLGKAKPKRKPAAKKTWFQRFIE